RGDLDARLEIKDGDEFAPIAMNIKKIVDSLKERVSKGQRVVRQYAILTELMGFISSELKTDVILKNLVDRTKDLIKSQHCCVIIFDPKTITTRFFIANEGIQDPSTVRLSTEGLFRKVLKDQVPLRIEKTGEHIEVPELNLKVKDILAVPLISSGDTSGVLILADKLKDSFDHEDEDMLMDFAFQAFLTVSVHEEIIRLAVVDGLTGLNNHRHFQERLKDEIARARRYGREVSLLILDIDHFKNFNDIYGHQVGDRVLKSISSIIKEQIRATDLAARYGGEEFAVILPETDYAGSRILAERLRKKIAETPFILPNGERAFITISIGFASFPENAGDKDEFIGSADKALYFAKEHGRNMTCGFAETLEAEPVEAEKGAWYLEHASKSIEASVIENLAMAVDSRTPYTKGHSAEVARLSVALARELGLSGEDIERLRTASILHDIGSVSIPDKILNKPCDLTEEEKKIIMAHPGLAEMLLGKYPHIEEILPAILYHHERFDGNGYPNGLKGEEIPLHARILAIAEAFNAMVSPRPYKKSLTIQQAIDELKAESGRQFDPKLVKVFIKFLNTQISTPK
ncbi:MAG: diguanylate cyclase, partial [Nitrospirae bacterium]|nr:diguanylate cyclase [Nitrospirota bacterium]